MKVHAGLNVYIHIFLTSGLAGGKCGQLHVPAASPPPSTHYTGDWVGPIQPEQTKNRTITVKMHIRTIHVMRYL
jgi:hypothetical protein